MDTKFLHADNEDWSDCTQVQADLSLHFAHISEGTFSHYAGLYFQSTHGKLFSQLVNVFPTNDRFFSVPNLFDKKTQSQTSSVFTLYYEWIMGYILYSHVIHFTPEFLTWTLLSLRLDTSTAANSGFSQWSEWQTLLILMRWIVTAVCKDIVF